MVSGAQPYPGNTATTTNGSFNTNGCIGVTFSYQWLRNVTTGVGSSQTYVLQSADVGTSITSLVTVNATDQSTGDPVSNSAGSNAINPTNPMNGPPYTCCWAPTNGSISNNALPTFSTTYTDPEGDSGNVVFRLYNSIGTLVNTSLSVPVTQSQTAFWTVPSSLACGTYSWSAQATDFHGNTTGESARVGYRVNCIPSAPTLVTPSSAAVLSTLSAVLSVSATTSSPRYDADGDPIYYDYQVATDSGFSTIVKDSGPLAATTDFAVPAGVLNDAGSYWWRVTAGDYATGSFVGSTSAPGTFSVTLARFGVRPYWPIWSHGPLSVNEATGNLILGVPTPSYPASVSSLSMSIVYNSRLATDRGLGAGWTVSPTGADLPARLIDHNFTTTDHFDAIERVSADGSSDYYTHVAGTNTYLPPPGDNSQLTQNPAGWTLTDPDGSVFNYNNTLDSEHSYGLVSAVTTDGTPGQGKLAYAYNGIRLTSITDTATSRALTLNWNAIVPASCSTAILCVTGPDGVTWTYKGDGTGNTSGNLVRVSNGTRDLALITYAGGYVSKLQNANDLNPTGASPGYNGTHALSISYTSNKVTSVSEGPISTQTPTTSTWSFGYEIGCSVGLDAPAVAGHQTIPARSATGCTTMRPPNQQPSGAVVRTFWDNLARPLEVIDVLGNHSELGWTANNDLLWSEDKAGNPTDYTYDAFNDSLTQVTGADPDGGGALLAPVTQYRYDETQVGSAATRGPGLQGVKAEYYKNGTLNPAASGGPDALQTDPNIDFNWGAGGPAAVSPLTDGFSIRWSGVIVAPSTGSYVFSTVTGGSDEQTKFSIDGVDAIDNWTTPTQTATSATLQLTQGQHRFTLEYAEISGTAEAHLRWACANCSPVITTVAVPQSAMQPGWLNKTSTVAASGRIGYSHYAAGMAP